MQIIRRNNSEMQDSGQSHGTRGTAAPSNKRGAIRGRGGSRLARTRPTSGDHTNDSDDRGKSMLHSLFAHTHTHNLKTASSASGEFHRTS